jgi:hypothetical protein
MIALIGSGRSVAVVTVERWGTGLYYKSVKSSMQPISIGMLPHSGALSDIAARNPRFRRPWIVVEYEDGGVYAAQLQARKTRLGEWIEVYPSANIVSTVDGG